MHNVKTTKMVKRIIYIILGSFIYSCGINGLFMRHNLYSGGLTGIAMFIEYYSRIPTAYMVPILNIPLFIEGYKYISKRFTYLSIIGITRKWREKGLILWICSNQDY